MVRRDGGEIDSNQRHSGSDKQGTNLVLLLKPYQHHRRFSALVSRPPTRHIWRNTLDVSAFQPPHFAHRHDARGRRIGIRGLRG
jgi:hypothetical protein